MIMISTKKLNRVFKSIYKAFKGWHVEIQIAKKENNPEEVKEIIITIVYPDPVEATI